MLSKLLHEIIDVMHGRGLIDTDKVADLRELVAQAVPEAEADIKADAATVEGQAAEDVKTVEGQAAAIAGDGSASDEPAGA